MARVGKARVWTKAEVLLRVSSFYQSIYLGFTSRAQQQGTQHLDCECIKYEIGNAGLVCTVAACPGLATIAYGTEDGGVWVMEHSAAPAPDKRNRLPSLQIAGMHQTGAAKAFICDTTLRGSGRPIICKTNHRCEHVHPCVEADVCNPHVGTFRPVAWLRLKVLSVCEPALFCFG